MDLLLNSQFLGKRLQILQFRTSAADHVVQFRVICLGNSPDGCAVILPGYQVAHGDQHDVIIGNAHLIPLLLPQMGKTLKSLQCNAYAVDKIDLSVLAEFKLLGSLIVLLVHGQDCICPVGHQHLRPLEDGAIK